MPISLHEEDPTLNEVNGVNKGVISDKMGIGGAPAISEDVMVARDVMLALETGAKVDIQHISSGRSVDLVRLAKKKGAKVYAEATPHHFTLTEEDVPNYGTMAKMNPPLRTEWDRTKIIEGLADGTIDMIATDHAPHAIEEKEREFTKAPSGIVGLETSLSLGITSLVKRGYLTMMQLLEKMKEGSYDKGELVSLRVRIQNMQFKLMKAEETSATLYENFATGLLDEQEYQMLREHYTEEKEKLETGIRV